MDKTCMYKNDLTIIMPYWNVEKEYFTDTMNMILQHGVSLVIYNDCCDIEYREQLFYYEDNPLVTIIDGKENKGQPTATYEALQNVKTKYAMRVDSDDLLLSLPETKNNDFDILLIRRKTGKNLYKWLEKGGSPNGCIFKTEIFKLMYIDHIFMGEKGNWFHEDNYALVKMFLNDNFNKYNIEISKNIKCYKRVIRPCSEATNKSSNRMNMRFETFKLIMMYDPRYNIEDFLIYDIAIRGAYQTMLHQGILSQELVDKALELKEQNNV